MVEALELGSWVVGQGPGNLVEELELGNLAVVHHNLRTVSEVEELGLHSCLTDEVGVEGVGSLVVGRVPELHNCWMAAMGAGSWAEGQGLGLRSCWTGETGAAGSWAAVRALRSCWRAAGEEGVGNWVVGQEHRNCWKGVRVADSWVGVLVPGHRSCLTVGVEVGSWAAVRGPRSC